MRSPKQLRDELGFVQECRTLFEAMQQTALSQLARTMEERHTSPSPLPSLEQWCLPLVTAAGAARDDDRAPETLLGAKPSIGGEEMPRTDGGAANGSALVVMTGDQGLVGPLYHDVIRDALAHAREPSRWIAVGVRGSALLTERDVSHETVASPMDENVPSLMSRLATQLMRQCRQESLGQAWVVFSRFESMTRQTVTAQPLLPLPHPTTAVPEDLVIEPSRERALEQVTWAWVRSWLEEAWWSNRLAELAARILHLEGARDDLAVQTNALRRDLFKAMHEQIDTMVREAGAHHR